MMKTQHLSNQPTFWSSPWLKVILFGVFVFTALFSAIFLGTKLALLVVALLAITLGIVYLLILKGKVEYTLTPFHLQQHLFRGGWVVKWADVREISLCSVQRDGWHQPIPWIGVKLKHYTAYLDSICPRIATTILLEQRSLLYIGAHQHNQTQRFEDIVLDSKPFVADGKTYTGLQAMLANRMAYQREFHGYDVFISANDLDRDPNEFIGLTRRYLAASVTENELTRVKIDS